MQHHVTALLAASAAIVTVLTGCGGPGEAHHSPTGVEPTASSELAPQASVPTVGPEALPPVRSLRSRDPFLPRFTDVLLRTEDPDGSGPQIALRFLRALQAGEYLRAAQQLSPGERITVALHSASWLRNVMVDVVDNAQLTGSASCTTAASVSEQAAVVSCGWLRVVVHVRTGFMPGVQINSFFPHDDVFLGPHTHAFTTYDI